MCYIEGGTPPGGKLRNKGCTDKTPPAATELVSFPYELFFARNSRFTWSGGGVAFIKPSSSQCGQIQRVSSLNSIPDDHALGRLYLITLEQFREIVAQENAVANASHIPIAFDSFSTSKTPSVIQLFKADTWYGSLHLLGHFPFLHQTKNHEQRYPILTFTNSEPHTLCRKELNAPCREYIETILHGLTECLELIIETEKKQKEETDGTDCEGTHAQLKQFLFIYLKRKKGIDGNSFQDQLPEIIDQLLMRRSSFK